MPKITAEPSTGLFQVRTTNYQLMADGQSIASEFKALNEAFNRGEFPGFWKRIELIEQWAQLRAVEEGYPYNLKGLAIAITSKQRKELEAKANPTKHEKWLLEHAPVCDLPKRPQMGPLMRDVWDLLAKITALRSFKEKGDTDNMLFVALDLGELFLRARLRGDPERMALAGKGTRKGGLKSGGKPREASLELRAKIQAHAQAYAGQKKSKRLIAGFISKKTGIPSETVRKHLKNII